MIAQYNQEYSEAFTKKKKQIRMGEKRNEYRILVESQKERGY
jgi:hypothetical protein